MKNRFLLAAQLGFASLFGLAPAVARAAPEPVVIVLETEALPPPEVAAARGAIAAETRASVVDADDPRAANAPLRARVRRLDGATVAVEVHRVASSTSRLVELPPGGARLPETAALMVAAMVRDGVSAAPAPTSPPAAPTSPPTAASPAPTAPEDDLGVTLRALGAESRDGRALRAAVSAAPILVLAPVSAVMFARDEPGLGALSAGFAGGSAVWSSTQLAAHWDPHAKLLVRYEDALAAGKSPRAARDETLQAWAGEASDARAARRTVAMADMVLGGALVAGGGAWLLAAPKPQAEENVRVWRSLGWTGLSLGTVAVIAGIDAWTSPWPVEASWQAYRTARPALARRTSVSVGMGPGGATVSVGGVF